MCIMAALVQKKDKQLEQCVQQSQGTVQDISVLFPIMEIMRTCPRTFVVILPVSDRYIIFRVVLYFDEK